MAAHILVQRGIRPILVDADVECKPDPENDQKLATFPLKSHLGSFKTYYQNEFSSIEYKTNVKTRQNFTFGGFSRVWGATVDFFDRFNGWPDNMRPSESDLREVIDFLQIKDFNERKQAHNTQLFEGRVTKLRSFRLMESILALQDSGPNKCINLLKCVSGCPSDSIWFSGNSIDRYLTECKLDYFSGLYLERIEKSGNFAVLKFVDAEGESVEVTGAQVF
jgi:ferredoxin